MITVDGLEVQAGQDIWISKKLCHNVGANMDGKLNFPEYPLPYKMTLLEGTFWDHWEVRNRQSIMLSHCFSSNKAAVANTVKMIEMEEQSLRQRLELLDKMKRDIHAS